MAKGQNNARLGHWRRDVIYKAIADKIKSLGFPPTIMELRALSGLKSTSTVHLHLKKLAQDGMLVQGAAKSYYLSPKHYGFLSTPSFPRSLWVVA